MPNQKHINKKHLAHLEVIHRQDRIIRISALVIMLLVVGIVGYGVLTNTVLLPYREVASVNNDKITAGEFQTQVKIQRIQAINRYMQYIQYAQMLGIQDPLNDSNFGPVLQQDSSRLNSTDVMGQEVVDLLINDRLIRQEAKKRNIAVSNDELEKALQESFQYFPNGTPTLTPTPVEVVNPPLNPTSLAIVTITPTASPVPTSTPDPNVTPTQIVANEPTATTGPTATNEPTATAVSADGYKTLLTERVDGLKKDTGMDETGYRRLVETSLLSDKLMADITKDQKPFQEEVWARHILVKTKEEADAVLVRLKAGEDFAKIAAEVSTDTGTKDKGGDLGWFGKGAMVAPFEGAAFGLKVGWPTRCRLQAARPGAAVGPGGAAATSWALPLPEAG
jgi:parvulin-like peptidyl-prolyl isomerase